jgi:rhodanese-related sulfurtransferase
MITITRRRWLACWAVSTLLTTAAQPGRAANPLQWPDVKTRIRSRFPTVPQLSVATVAAWLNDPVREPPMLLDTREVQEFADGHLPGAARVQGVDEALQKLQQRPAGGHAVLYCSVGYRSSALAAALLSRGVQRIHNLEGSLFEWANGGHPVIAGDGRPGKVHPYDRTWGTLLRRELWSREPDGAC